MVRGKYDASTNLQETLGRGEASLSSRSPPSTRLLIDDDRMYRRARTNKSEQEETRTNNEYSFDNLKGTRSALSDEKKRNAGTCV